MLSKARPVKFAAPAALALTALALAALPGAARAETIARERLGCHTPVVNERLLALVQADDEEGYGRLLRGSLASGECKYWKPGEEVRIEGRTPSYGCLSGPDAAESCYWTSLTAFEKPE